MGGNVSFGGLLVPSRIHLDGSSGTRHEITLLKVADLGILNSRFGLWSEELFESRKFFSGSSYHLFDHKISDEEFCRIKDSVGDIDVQVSSLSLLDGLLVGDQCGSMILLGKKHSGHQLITLWFCETLNQNIQIDFEEVEFIGDWPSNWARFSHSSPWIDMCDGIKGVFHKLAIRALCSIDLEWRMIETPRTKKSVMCSTMAFSVTRGLRKKLRKLGSGNWETIPINESRFTTDPRKIFESFFPESYDVSEIYSFGGILRLVTVYWSYKDRVKFLLALSHSIFGPEAQVLYRDNIELDIKEKTIAITTAILLLDIIDCNSFLEQQLKAYKTENLLMLTQD